MEKNYGRTVSLQCPTCGGEAFEHEPDGQTARCLRCDLELTKDELRRANEGRIADEVQAVKNEIVKDLKADFAKAFKKWK